MTSTVMDVTRPNGSGSEVGSLRELSKRKTFWSLKLVEVGICYCWLDAVCSMKDLRPCKGKALTTGSEDVWKLQNHFNIMAVHEAVNSYIHDSTAPSLPTGQMSVAFTLNLCSKSYETCFVQDSGQFGG
jgi:hypothetical protein